MARHPTCFPRLGTTSFIGPVAHLPLLAAAVSVAGIFGPGFLLLATVLPFWQRISAARWAPAALAAVNAALVGLLAASATAFLLFTSRSPLWIVAWCVCASILVQTPSVY